MSDVAFRSVLAVPGPVPPRAAILTVPAHEVRPSDHVDEGLMVVSITHYRDPPSVVADVAVVRHTLVRPAGVPEPSDPAKARWYVIPEHQDLGTRAWDWDEPVRVIRGLRPPRRHLLAVDPSRADR